jgi:anaerobic selenocysteine-containing dehydrogenase
MSLSRRDFLKLAGACGAAGFLGGVVTTAGCSPLVTLKGTKKVRTICSLCSLGCGLIVRMRKGVPVYVEGDSAHPVNNGALCARAFLIPSLFNEKLRAVRVGYRAPGASEWTTISWESALSMIAARIKKTRDESFVQFDGASTVNRTEGIAALAGSSLTNEEGYLFAKFCRLIGIPHIGTESLVRGDARKFASHATFGLFGSTNPWTDLSNADCVLILGTNLAKRMPVAMRYLADVRARGGMVITIDPLATETASTSDLHCAIRPGSDTAFLLGLINYAYQNNRCNRQYLVECTDAPLIVNGKFSYDRTRGIFGGYDRKTGSYPPDFFDYERDARGNPLRDDELRNMRTVYQLLKNHVSAYTPQYVYECTGCPPDVFLRAADIFCSSSDSSRASAVITGFSCGGSRLSEQTYRAAAMLQLMLGNIGVSGGGIYQVESFGNTLGVDCQIPMWDMLPGMIPLPKGGSTPGGNDSDFQTYLKNHQMVSNDAASVNQWQNLKSYMVGLLKSWYGNQATEQTRFNFDWLPKGKNVFTTETWLASFGTQYKGALFMGADLAAYNVSLDVVTRSLASLDWIVVSDIGHTDSTDFWKKVKCGTEVFFLPSATLFEKEGTILSASRWIEKRNTLPVVNSEIRGELQILDDLFKLLKKEYASGGALPEQLTYASWTADKSSDILREMSGIAKDGDPVSSKNEIREDGSVSCGNILFCGVANGNRIDGTDDDIGNTRAKIFRNWGWSVPENVRVLYNGAGLDADGNPRCAEKRVSSISDSFSGHDVLHGISKKGERPFVLNREGTAYLFSGRLRYGPFPDQYNGIEGIPKVADHPALPARLKGAGGPVRVIAVAENRYTLENIPQEKEFALCGVCEISQALASDRRISTGDFVRITSSYGSVTATALVTERLKRFQGGRTGDYVILRGGTFRQLSGSVAETVVAADIIKMSDRRTR